ncbi:MAG: hypothetical protein CM15mP102_06080 [Flavobacteriales bacterium]|nr:MAG: hypothetical protein CM15mP102_06080 [Flavobacteriales bacterium]
MALIPEKEGIYELNKMAVKKAKRQWYWASINPIYN